MRSHLIVLSIVLALSSLAFGGRAADLGGDAPPPGIETPDIPAITVDLTRYAVLYELRAAFDVLDPETIPDLLKSDLAKLSDGTADIGELNANLTAEGSYYIVSLRYLVDFGGANWPTDRPAIDYTRDARLLLESLQSRWLAAVSDGGDLVEILGEIDRINAWTEGFADLPSDLDHSRSISAMVNEILTKYGPLTAV